MDAVAPSILEGRVALVTGASGGLGAHFAEILAAASAEVIIAARRAEALAAVAGRIQRQGGRCSTAILDVTDSTSIAAVAGLLSRVDILVNNAGMVREAAFLDQTETDWDEVIDTNLKGMFLMTKAAASAMKAHGRAARSSISLPSSGSGRGRWSSPMPSQRRPRSN